MRKVRALSERVDEHLRYLQSVGAHFGADASFLREQQTEITALRAALDQERARIRELAESPPMASISLCCGIVRPGYYAPPTMHNGLCRSRHGGELGKTYYLHDVSALLSGRGEGGNDA